MAITAEQAAQLASTYQAGDTSGLQGLVSSMGVTAGDVAQYFPGFDVGSLQGITLAPSAPVAPPAPTYGTGKFTGDVISNYIAANLQNPELIAQKAKEFGISASDIQKAAGYTPEQQARFFSYAGVTPTGIAGLTPLSYGDKGQFTAKEVMDYVNRYIDDPTRLSQAAQRYTITPEQLQTLYAGSATPYALGDIQKYFETGQKGLPTRLQDIITSTIGSPDVLKSVEGALPAATSRLSAITPESVSKRSIEEIEKLIAESPTNRLQEASRVRSIAENIYGLSSDKARQMASDLISGKDTDDFAEKLYGDLLKGGYSKDLQTKILQDAVARSPNSPFFKENPEQLLYYSPIGEKKAVGENSNQYGIDPKTGLPFVHLGAAKNTLGTGEVFVRPFREEKGQGELGYHPHSTYAGFIANGVGVFGAKAGQSDINYFDKIEKEIAKLGGIRSETNEEGQVYNYVNVQETDPETGQKYTRKVSADSLFSQPEEDFKQTRTYQEYRNTQDALRAAAKQAGIPETKYTSTKQAYEDLNNRFKDFYVIQGRTDTLDPAAAKTLGIPDVKDNKKHATILYQAVNDKLVPQKVLKTFDFQDPNTTRGFFGDLATAAGSFLSIPPVAAFLTAGGGLPALFSGTFGTPAAATAASALAGQIGSSVLDSTGIGSLLANTGLSFSQIGNVEQLIGKALLQGGSSALTTGLITGDIDAALKSGLAGLVGAGVSGGTELGLGPASPFNFAQELNLSPGVVKAASEILGGSAARAATGQDPGTYAVNRLLNLGIGALANVGAEKAGVPTKGPEAEVFKAMVPIITTKKVEPEDIRRLAVALEQAGYVLESATA